MLYSVPLFLSHLNALALSFARPLHALPTANVSVGIPRAINYTYLQHPETANPLYGMAPEKVISAYCTLYNAAMEFLVYIAFVLLVISAGFQKTQRFPRLRFWLDFTSFCASFLVLGVMSWVFLHG